MRLHRFFALCVVISFCGTSTLAQDADRPKADAGGASKPRSKPRRSRKPTPQADAPPDCPRHQQDAPERRRPASPERPEEFPGASALNRMMQSMEGSPATGFRDFMGEQEEAALTQITLSAEEERRIGRNFRDRYLADAKARGYPVVDDPKKLAYLRALVEKLAKRMKHRDRYAKIQVTLIDAPIADGQSCPGGYLIFTTALIDKSPDEATVAGVVAHELAHLDRGHLYHYAKREKLVETAFNGPGDFSSPNGLSRMMERGMAAGNVFMNPFKPHHELEADCQAATWMYQEGYDPRAMARFFEKLHQRQQDRPDDPLFQFTRSHPYSLDRRAEVLSRLEQLRRWQRRNDLGLFPENLQKLEVKPETPVGEPTEAQDERAQKRHAPGGRSVPLGGIGGEDA